VYENLSLLKLKQSWRESGDGKFVEEENWLLALGLRCWKEKMSNRIFFGLDTTTEEKSYSR
jgi:hypothetical protein